MRRVVVALGFVCLLLQPLEALAQLGTITGVITDAGTSAQIAGGVQAYTADGLLAQITGSFAGSPTTPYQILGLQPGTYFLKGLSDGYVPELHGGLACVAAGLFGDRGYAGRGYGRRSDDGRLRLGESRCVRGHRPTGL